MWEPTAEYKPVLDLCVGGYAAEFDRDKTYTFMRSAWGHPQAFRLRDVHPAFNVAGLYYRPLPSCLGATPSAAPSPDGSLPSPPAQPQ